jgi:hypothetical protein
VERGHQGVADDSSQQRKPDFRTAVEDVKALATVLVMKLESVLGRRLQLRSPAVVAAIGVVATLVLALVVVIALLQTGDANAVSDNAALIGALVALGGVFTAQLVSIALEDRRTQEAHELEAERAQEARNLEAGRAGEAALQNYFEAVGELLIEKQLHRASPGDRLSTVVRAQTLSVLEGLDPDRKRILLLFLYESGLIYKDKPVVSLAAANLRGAILPEAKLPEADLRGVYLSGANLTDAYLIYAHLGGADLRRANLTGAVLGGASLNRAYLSNVDLSHAILRRADLRGANMGWADLSGASLREADLRRTHILGATGVTSQSLEQQAYSLEGAIMPDGSKHP